MKLQSYLPETIKAITDNKEIIVNHIYYLQCLQHIQAESAPKNITIRLIWDITRIPAAREIMNKVWDEGAHDEHIETLFKEAVKQSDIFDGLKDLTDDTKEKIMLDAMDSAEREIQRKAEQEKQKADEQAKEQERIERGAREEYENRMSARALYRGYGSEMTDKQFDKFHEVMSEKKLYDEGKKLITTKEFIEDSIQNRKAYPVIYPKGHKRNSKPFDIYELQCPERDEKGNLHIFLRKLKKAEYLYAVYLHGGKNYNIGVGRYGEEKKFVKFTAVNPIEAIYKYAESIGLNSLTAFADSDGICYGEWNGERRQFTIDLEVA